MRQQNHPTAASALEEVRRIVLGILGKQPVSVYLFGSWARGAATSQSDIDLAIEAHSPLPPGLLALLRERLEESHVPYHVEVVELSGVDPEFRRRILGEAVRWNG
jgi:predicted nucleotidyltransferase